MLSKILDNRFFQIGVGISLLHMGIDSLRSVVEWGDARAIVSIIMGVCLISGAIFFLATALKGRVPKN